MNKFAEKYFKFLENEKTENPCSVIKNLIKQSVVKTSIYFPWCDTPNHPALELENWILFVRSPEYCIEFANNCFDKENKIKKSFHERGFPNFVVFQNKWLDYSKNNPNLAIKYIKHNGCIPELEDIISQDANCSIEYSEITNSRFKLGEKSILKDPKITMRYLINILHVKDRNDIPDDVVDKIEKTVSEDPESAYFYSFLINKKRFELGEKAISKNAEYSFLYAKNILCSRFELGEKSISKDAEYSFIYAASVAAGRLPQKMHETMELKGFQKV